jgi:lipoprotein-anchoring transpeptidase ErfK/SrfK
VTVGERTFRLSAERAGVRLALGRAVSEAHELSREEGLLARMARRVTGEDVDRDVETPVAYDRRAVRGFVGDIHAAVSRAPREAELDIELTSVKVTKSRTGRRLAGRDDLVRRIGRALTDPDAVRSLRARTTTIAPKTTTEQVMDRTPVVVTVAREGTTVRVFRRGELTKTYRVAVGEPKYPTPPGRFTVQSKQVNPTWNVPQSDWAGDLAGKVIPGGDPQNPLVARWIGFNGSVGFHGTKALGSIGSFASHGCVRMRPDDVIDLYERVEVGTPVLVV